MKVDYSRQTLNAPNPIARFAHRKRYELSIENVSNLLKEGQALLDYGCGKGDFLIEISRLRSDVRLFGYDPESGHTSEKYNVIESMDSMEANSVDVFCSFETLEHLYDDERAFMYTEAKRVLKESGILVVSVPIIGGPPLLLKELNRMLLFRRKSEYSVSELFKASLFGIPGARPGNPRPTHKGFDFREIQRELESNFRLVEKNYSPFPFLGWYMNSQVFFICEKS